jgi:hypothetical protein
MNDELKRIRNEAVVAYSRYCSGILMESLRKSTKYFSVRMISVPVEIRIENLPDKSQYLYGHISLLGTNYETPNCVLSTVLYLPPF